MRRVTLVDYGKLVLQGNCGDIEVLEPGTIKIDVTACSICGGGIALYHRKRSLENERYFGYEFSGVVAGPGDGANGIKEGMCVASELSRACGHCWSRHNGLPNYCKSMDDTFLPGGFSEETLVLDMPGYSFINPVPDTVNDITMTLSEPTNCAYHMARRAGAKHGETTVVFGMGPMGLIAARIIKSMSVDMVMGMNSSKARLEKVQNLRFIGMIDSNDGNRQDQIFEMCDSKGADVIIELTGVPPALQNAFRMVRPGGRIMTGSAYGSFADQVKLLPIMRRELTILDFKSPYPHLKTNSTSAAVDILMRLQDDLKKLITAYDYKDALKAFDDTMSGFAIRPVIRFRS